MYLIDENLIERDSNCPLLFFCWLAAVWGPFWALSKKMYLWALPVSVSLFVNGNFAISLVRFYRRFTQETDDYNILMPHIQNAARNFLWLLGIWIIYQLISTYLYGKYGNRLYYKHVKDKISQGYHLVGDVNATLSPLSIVLILAGPIIALPFVVPGSIMLLVMLNVKFIEVFLTDDQIGPGIYTSIAFFVIFSIGEFLYYKADSMAVKRFKQQHECLDLQVSEKNIQKYLVEKGKNTYLKIVDWMILGGIILCIGSALYLEFYYQSPRNRKLQEYYEKNF